MAPHHPPAGNLMAGWAPVRWSWNAGQPLVDWCDLGPLRLVAPFFAQTAQAAQERSPATRQTTAEALAALPAQGPGAAPSGLIFHLSRGGSTLAAQALAASAENIVLAEPETMDAVLRASRIHPGVTDAMRAGWLRGLAKAYGWPRFAPERRLFIKFDAWHVLDFDVVRQAFPNAPWIFLYRDPVEILVSQTIERSARMRPDPFGASWLGVPLLEALQTPPDAFCARALGRIAAAAADALDRDPRGLAVNYTDLPGAMETIIGPHFGLPLTDHDRGRMQAASECHAKWPGRPFRPDSAGKQALANSALRELADRWVGPAFERLEGIRARQRRASRPSL